MKIFQSTIPVAFGFLFGAIMFYNTGNSQMRSNVLHLHSFFWGHDLAFPLFGKTVKKPHRRNTTIKKYFIPVAGYQFSLSKQVSFFSEWEYRDMLTLWCAGITITISK